jgi:hypothetical protein
MARIEQPPVSVRSAPGRSPRRRVRRWALRAAEAVIPEHNPGAVVYGTIAIGALLAAESGLHETYAAAIISATIAACLYWFAYAYANLLGRRLVVQEPLTAGGLVRALAHDAGMMLGAAIPLVTLLACWLAGVAEQTAITVALWSAIGAIVAFEVAAGLRARSTSRELALEVCFGVTMGLGILALRTLLH